MALTSADQFAALGNPLATAKDWMDEVELASNPTAPTRARDQALDYVRPAEAPQPRRPFVEAPRPLVVSERAKAMQVERDNLKLMLAAIGAHSRTIKPAAPAPLPPVNRVPLGRGELTIQEMEAKLAEPKSYPAPKPLEMQGVSREEHDRWTAERLARIFVSSQARIRGATLSKEQLEVQVQALLAIQF